MGNAYWTKKSNNRGGGRGRNFGGGRNDRRSQMHDAVCDQCGEDCEVPFRPSGSKPVYCSRCFDQQGGGKDRSQGKRKQFGGNRNDRRQDRQPKADNNLKREIDALSNKLDKIVELLTPISAAASESLRKNSDKIIDKESAKPVEKVKKKTKKTTKAVKKPSKKKSTKKKSNAAKTKKSKK